MARIIKPVRLNDRSKPAILKLLHIVPPLKHELYEGSSELTRALLVSWAAGWQITPAMEDVIYQRVDAFYMAATFPFKVMEASDFDGLQGNPNESIT